MSVKCLHKACNFFSKFVNKIILVTVLEVRTVNLEKIHDHAKLSQTNFYP